MLMNIYNKKAVESSEEDLCMTCLRGDPPVDLSAEVFDWIECENCKAWHHQYCVGFDSQTDDFDWKCPLCVAEDLM
jgi:hypothetical protein